MKIQFELTYDDHIAFMQYQYEHDPDIKKRIASSGRTMMIVGLVFCLIMYLFTKDLLPSLITAGVIIIVEIFYPELYKRGLKKQVMSNPGIRDTLGLIEYEITPDSFVYRTQHAEIKTQWDGIFKVESTQDYIFIFTNPKSAHAIPARRLIKGDCDEFVQCLRAKVQLTEKKAP